LAELGQFTGHLLGNAIQATFEAARTHPIPSRLPKPPGKWNQGFRLLANEADLDNDQLEEAYSRIQELLDPVLAGKVNDKSWNTNRWSWEK
jgi:hypothetical protein